MNRLITQWRGPLLYLAAVFLLTFILSPLLYLALSPILPQPYFRYINRTLLISALVCLIPYFKRHRKELGLNLSKRWGIELMGGIGSGFAIVFLAYLFHGSSHKSFFLENVGAFLLFLLFLVLAAISLIKGILFLRFTTMDLKNVGIFFGSAILSFLAMGIVAFVEEVFFRGVVQTVLTKRLGNFAGLIVASFFFASAHFLKASASGASLVGKGLFLEGFTLFQSLEQPFFLSFPFLNLFLLGLVLGLSFIEFKRLWMPIGIHFGVILTLKLIYFALYSMHIPDFDPLHSALTSFFLTLIVVAWFWRLISNKVLTFR